MESNALKNLLQSVLNFAEAEWQEFEQYFSTAVCCCLHFKMWLGSRFIIYKSTLAAGDNYWASLKTYFFVRPHL